MGDRGKIWSRMTVEETYSALDGVLGEYAGPPKTVSSRTRRSFRPICCVPSGKNRKVRTKLKGGRFEW